MLLYATGRAGLVDVARLLVSEVVSNVYLHTGVPQVNIVATADRDGVLVSVEDRDPRGRPAGGRREVVGDEEHGRGLMLVQQCAKAWGVTWLGDGEPEAKRVWFELAAPPSPVPSVRDAGSRPPTPRRRRR